MAINYTKVGWDTSKYINPTNMNQMDDGIKAACDGVDAHDTAITNLNTALDGKIAKSSTLQTITNTATGQYVALFLKSSHSGNKSFVGFQGASGSTLGYLGIDENNKPVYQNGASGSTSKEIALKDNTYHLIATKTGGSSDTYQTLLSALYNTVGAGSSSKDYILEMSVGSGVYLRFRLERIQSYSYGFTATYINGANNGFAINYVHLSASSLYLSYGGTYTNNSSASASGVVVNLYAADL